jgi:hypothetical protein
MRGKWHILNVSGYPEIGENEVDIQYRLQDRNNNNINNKNLIQFKVFTCKLNSPEANYKASTSREEKTHTYKQNTKNNAIIIIIIQFNSIQFVFIYVQT